jgi:Bacterial conjugation TrbI-like protein
MKKRGIFLFLVVLLSLIGIATWFIVAHAPKSERPAQVSTKPIIGGMEDAPEVIPRDVPPPHGAATPIPLIEPHTIQASNRITSMTETPQKDVPMRIYTAQISNPIKQAEKEKEEHKGFYAPAWRKIRCKLIDTVDSSNTDGPVTGMVTDDLIWRGNMIIARCSEIHGRFSVDKNHRRIMADGAWTLTFCERDGLGNREMVVKGEALDREDDPEFAALMVGKTQIDTVKHAWEITDGSKGLRGVIINTSNNDYIKLFVATFISGIAQSVQGYSQNIFGQSVPSPQGQGIGGISGQMINPPASAAEAVLDRYAQLVMQSIEENGFFIRVPAGKQFYVLVSDDIDTGNATEGGAKRLNEVQNQFLEQRAQNEKVTQSRETRDNPQGKGLPMYPSLNPYMTRQLPDNEMLRSLPPLPQPQPTMTPEYPNLR